MAAWSRCDRRFVLAAAISLTAGLGLSATTVQVARAESAGAASVAVGGFHSCALESGKAYCWGSDTYGELGDGVAGGASPHPVAVYSGGVLAGKTLTRITVGYDDTCALDSGGAAYCWGRNYQGELGDGSTTESSVPVAVDTTGVLAGKTLTQITAEGGHGNTCALDTSGKAYCWGTGGAGDLGDGSTDSSSVPVAVDTRGPLTGKTLTQISGYGDTTCALDTAGAAYCWGYNYYGQLGDGSSGDTSDSSVPVPVDSSGALAGKELIDITAAEWHTCAVDAAGTAYCWGLNGSGQLGDGQTVNSAVPVPVDTNGVLAGKSLTQITAGWYTTCALDSAGTAYCWGDNYYGEFGDGGTANSPVPVPVDTGGALAGKDLVQISAADSQHTCSADAADALYCWGDNASGDLGNDSNGQSDVPALAGPQAPGGVSATPGDGIANIYWTAPGSLDGGTLTGYTATATPSGAACTTTGATSCTITGLSNGTAYQVSVVAHTTAGDSGASPAAGVTPGSGLAFTSNPADTASFGVPFSFTVTTTGSPSPKITKAGKLPPGVGFTDNRNGTATISGTPTGSAAGIYPLTLIAKNKTATATATFALTVTRAPSINKIPGHQSHSRHGTGPGVITSKGYPSPGLTQWPCF